MPAYGVIVGDGPLKSEVQQFILKEDLLPYIILTGFRSDVRELLAGFDYFILSSIEEGLGTSVLDAFLAKIPVVATNVGGIPEMVQHGETGMLVPARDSTKFAQYILQLHTSPELKQQVIENASKAVLRFSKEEMALKTLKIYQQTLLQ